MVERMVETALFAAAAYGGLGVLAAVPLHARGLGRIDPATRGTGFWFRVLVTPGLVALWPFLLMKWRGVLRNRETEAPVERPVRPESLRRLHGLLIHVLAVALPLAVAAALLTRSPVRTMPQSLPGVMHSQPADASVPSAH